MTERGSEAPVRTALIVAVSAFAVLLSSWPAGAYHAERERELQEMMADKRGDIARLSAREEDLLARLNESQQRQANLESRLRSADAALSAARAELAGIQTRLNAVTAELLEQNRVLEETTAELDESIAILNDRVAAMYMASPSAYAAAIQAAESLADLVDAAEYVNSVVTSDRELVDTIEATKIEVEAQRAQIEARKAELTEQASAAKATADRIQSIRDERAAAEAAIAREVAIQRDVLSQLRARKAYYRRVLQRYEQESAEIREFLQGSQAGQNVIQGRGGWLKWPVSGYISSGYGWRRHPIYGYRSFHTGIDIAASQGTTVGAARKGKVLYTGYEGAYGLIVLIDHGNSVATLYAHLSQTYVRAGEYVSTLEPVAAVGSTGWSTGPHLHFEVRVNGDHTNPMQWL